MENMNDDLISRQAAIYAADMADYPGLSIEDVDKVTGEVVKALKALPSAQPYTEAEIQAMQDLEQAQIDKAYELGWKEGREALREETWEYVRDRFD